MLTSRDLTKIINNNGGILLDSISIDTIRTYVELKQGYLTSNVAEDEEYQGKYVSFMGISGTGVNKEFLAKYFEVMEAHKKRENEFDFPITTRAIYGARPKKKLSSGQFTHVAKMANMVDPTNPTYDNSVADLFEFDKPVQTKLESRERLNLYMEFLSYISNVYEEMLEQKMIYQVMMVFKIKLKDYENAPELSKFKMIDMLMTAAASLKSKGELV